ncbi:MAG: MFS transporter [Rhodococcus sp. (in: high G+C Gram-positive bacteria)]
MTRSRAAAFVGVAYAFVVAMMGTTMPTPLYALYEIEFGFSVFVVTLVFAAYAVGVLGALLAFGRWSDSLGRRPMLLAAIGFGLISAAVFVTADSLTALVIGRVLSGLSAGIFVGTATVTLIELVPDAWRDRAPAIATAANIGGLGLGPLVAGLLAEYLPHPLRLTWCSPRSSQRSRRWRSCCSPSTAGRPGRPTTPDPDGGAPESIRGAAQSIAKYLGVRARVTRSLSVPRSRV